MVALAWFVLSGRAWFTWLNDAMFIRHAVVPWLLFAPLLVVSSRLAAAGSTWLLDRPPGAGRGLDRAPSQRGAAGRDEPERLVAAARGRLQLVTDVLLDAAGSGTRGAG